MSNPRVQFAWLSLLAALLLATTPTFAFAAECCSHRGRLPVEVWGENPEEFTAYDTGALQKPSPLGRKLLTRAHPEPGGACAPGQGIAPAPRNLVPGAASSAAACRADFACRPDADAAYLRAAQEFP